MLNPTALGLSRFNISITLLLQLNISTHAIYIFFLHFRCPYLYDQYTIGIPIYTGLLAIFVIANFGLATFMDPGTYPKGKYENQVPSAIKQSRFFSDNL